MRNPYLSFFYLLVCIGVAATLWFSGVHHGKGIATASCSVERLQVATTTNRELGRLKGLAEKYATQITDANDLRDIAQAELARLRSAPHAHLLCHAPAGSGGRPVPGFPAAAGGGAAGGGALPQGPDFDPSERLYAEVADACDNTVEKFRYVLGLWPDQGTEAVPASGR